MFKNYFFLNRFVIEANLLIKTFSAVDIFSQEKDKLIIELKNSETSYFLEFCVNPGFPFINLKEEFNRAKKNSIDIFPSLLNEKLLSLETAKFDRIIKLNFESSKVYFTIRGKFTNVIRTTGEKKESFKKYSKKDFTDFLNEVKSKEFSRDFNIPKITKIENSNFENEIKKYPFIGKEIMNEIEIRDKSENEFSSYNELYKIFNEIKTEKAAVFVNEKSSEIHISVKSFLSFFNLEIKTFENYITAQNFYLGKKYFLNEFQKKRKLIEKHLERELKKITSKLNKLKMRIEKGNNEELYKKIANLLLININNIRKGTSEIFVQDIYSDDKIKIILNPELSSRQNVDRYFEKSRNERKSFEKSQALYESLEQEFFNLKKSEKELLNSDNIKDLSFILKELKIKENDHSSPKDDIKNKFKQYLIEDKYFVFVGKDSQNNDLLTTKFAKQNDYWFHARGVPGSHVILKVDNIKEGIPKNILKKAASLAAFHSKAKTAGTVPVSYTLKKYVVKKKGMAAGKVFLLKEETLLVQPEIPNNCKYIEKD